MAQPEELLLIAMMVGLTALTNLAARRLHLPQSILLVVVGAAIAFAPRVPSIPLRPDFVLLVLLPPLLYAAGVGMSWRGFQKNMRAILLLAVGCVLFTAWAVAAAMHWLLQVPWTVGFVLGAVVSPPDAVAPMAIARRLSVPANILTTLEGEGLVNDATALILFSFAVAAVASADISITRATETFAVIVVGEIAWGCLVAWALLRLRAWARDPEVEMIIALLTPFAAFWAPHFLGGSGVLAAVAAGLWVSWHGPRLIPPATRLQGFFVWGLVVYVIEGVVFFITGLQARAVMQGPEAGEWPRMLTAGAVTVIVVVLVRFVWVFPATYLPLLMGRRRELPSWQETFLVGFTGIRGVVSLVAALSIPEMVDDAAFPQRGLILFATFCVILVSLIGQGAALPAVIRVLGLDRTGAREVQAAKRAERSARVAGIEAALERLRQLEANGAVSRAAASLRRQHEDRRLNFLQADAAQDGNPAADAAVVQLQLLDAERVSIAQQFEAGKLTDEARRRVERELDLEDARIRHAVDSATEENLFHG